MTPGELQLVYAFETHAIDEVRAMLDSGLDASAPLDGKTPVQWLFEMYFRSDRFPDCLRLLLDRGAVLDDPILGPVLLDDPAALSEAIEADPSLIAHRTNMVSTFTPLIGATLLHVAAEYGHAKAARVLIDRGADVNARAALDEHGLDGHTALFHTVNSNNNRSAPIMQMLMSAGAKCDIRLPGLTWGKGFEWETTFFDVTPISYCQLGLLPQVHRREQDIYANTRLMLEASGRSVPPMPNIPNRYLQPKGKT